MRTPPPGAPVSPSSVPELSLIAWTSVGIGTDTVAAAERDALGTTARMAVWPPQRLTAALAGADTEIGRLDREASRFREDSEISCIHRAGGGTQWVTRGLAEAVGVALAAARWTGGLVDPTIGGALNSLGYDRDFAAIRPDLDTDGRRAPDAQTPAEPLPRPAPVPGWRSVILDGTRLTLPAGILLDLGATAKGLGSDRAATAAAAAIGNGGVLVSLGGDIAVAGEAPAGGWPVAIADSAGPAGEARPRPARVPGSMVRLASGAVATSSVTCRQWSRNGRLMHHIVDPRTGRPAAGPWRTVSVAAATCAEANAAATAAIVAGGRAEAWLAATGLPGRLVTHDGKVRLLGGWPGTGDRPLPPPPPPRLAPWPGTRSGGDRD
jgi:thiamine biosynthesis lipoprotein